MASLKDLVKQALDKKNGTQQSGNQTLQADQKVTGHSQVNTNKPSKKSAGRGR